MRTPMSRPYAPVGNQRRSDAHHRPNGRSTDNIPSSEREPGMDNLRRGGANETNPFMQPRTAMAGYRFKMVGNSRGPVMDYRTASGGYHNPGKHNPY